MNKKKQGQAKQAGETYASYLFTSMREAKNRGVNFTWEGFPQMVHDLAERAAALMLVDNDPDEAKFCKCAAIAGLEKAKELCQS